MGFSDNSIRVLLRGGLGNNLFQLAAALAFSRQKGLSIQIDPTYARGFLEPRTESLLRQLASSLSMEWLIDRPKPHFLAISSQILNGYQIVTDRNSNRALEKSSNFKRATLTGYFQNWTLFEAEIREVSSLVSQSLSDIFSTPRESASGAIHLRLGDYARMRRIYGTVDEKYILEALEKLAERSGGALPIRVFSNDLPSAELRFGKLPLRIEFIDSGGTLETLHELSRSSWIVGSNSSFSWWSAAIGGFKPITLPAPFLLDKRLNSRLDFSSENVRWVNRDISG